MKNLRLAAFIIIFVAIGAAGAWFLRPQAYRNAPGTQSPAPAAQPVALATPPPAAASVATPASIAAAATKTNVAIQDEKTIDFSSGKPVVKDSAEDKAIIANSVKEMNEAAAGITFGPAPKPAEPAAKPPAPPQ
jgi:hypothetical protein